jgi:hypothetical protein
VLPDYWNNLEKLSQHRFDKEATLNMQDFRFWFLKAWMAKKEIGQKPIKNNNTFWRN